MIVLGGTFDPIHMGHLAIAEAANRQLKPQRVLFIPGGQSPHKHDRQITCAEHRYKMTALAVCEHPSFDISRIEINRQGPSYTIDTARALYAVCPPNAKISFLIGDDALMKILSWKDANELLKLCEFVVVPRPEYEKDEVTEKSMAEFSEYLAANYSARIKRLNSPLHDISSTEIRKYFKTDQSVQGLIPRSVENYVRQHGFYNAKKMPEIGMCDITPTSGRFCFKTAEEELRIRLSPKRYAHTMGVVAEAEKLAIHYAEDINKARAAALLHDCAKEYSADKKRILCQQWGVQLDAVLEADIDLTHCLLSAESATRDFHIYDSETLQAIRYHTTGHKGMTMLDKIIMLADYIEPTRPDRPPANEMRQLALINIDKALILRINHIVKKETQAGRPIHPWSKDALKELKGE